MAKRVLSTDEGLIDKYRVTRTDGRDAEGEKHHDCRYFVLDLTHDDDAIQALRFYAVVIEDRNPALAHDLRGLVYGMYRMRQTTTEQRE